MLRLKKKKKKKKGERTNADTAFSPIQTGTLLKTD